LNEEPEKTSKRKGSLEKTKKGKKRENHKDAGSVKCRISDSIKERGRKKEK